MDVKLGHIAQFVQNASYRCRRATLPERSSTTNSSPAGAVRAVPIAQVRDAFQDCMTDHCGVFTKELMREGLTMLQQLGAILANLFR